MPAHSQVEYWVIVSPAGQRPRGLKAARHRFDALQRILSLNRRDTLALKTTGTVLALPRGATLGTRRGMRDGMLVSQTRLRAWERAEILRSVSEAAHTDSTLRASERLVARYSRPPAGTPYPLEYSFHLLGEAQGKRVVDFGCRSGGNVLLLARRGARVVGVDLSEPLVRLAARRLAVNGVAPAGRFLVCSAHELPLPDEAVDIVFGIAILHHLDLAVVSRETFRVLRLGGRAIFQEPVCNSTLLRIGWKLLPRHAEDISPFERPLTDAELTRFAQGFQSIRGRYFCLPHVRLGQRLPLSRRRLDALYRMDAALLRRLPALWKYATIRVIELVK